MKFSDLLCWTVFLLYIDVGSAFTSNSSPTGIGPTCINSMTAIKNSNEPHPPDFPPRVDEQLGLDLMESQRRVMLYEKEVEMIREQLELQQDELLEEQNSFRDEKNNLMGKIEQFASILVQRDNELAGATAVSGKVVDLEQKIKSLQTKLTEKTNSLKDQKRSNEEIRNRFDDAEDALEFEQMNFEKERNALQQLVTEERQQVKALTAKFKESSKSFEKSRKELSEKIQIGEVQLNNMKTKWKETQNEMKQIEEKLQLTLQEKSQILKENLPKYYMKDLKDQIQKDQQDIKEMKKELENKNNLMKESSETLEGQISSEQKKIDELKSLLTDEKSKYHEKKTALDEEIENVNENLADVETQLLNERASFSKEKEMLEKKLANEMRVGRLKKEQMKKRYDEIRTEMTDLWNSSKRQARQEENRLRKKYNKQLDIVKSQVAKLEKDLILEKDRSTIKKDELELKHTKDVEIRDASIAKLEGNIVDFRRIIVDKDQIIEEKNQQIKGYETSFRQLARLGLKVTGNKVKKIAGPLKRIIQNEPPSTD